MIRNNQTTQILEWLGTSILIIGVGINSLGYYPLGPIVMIFGGLTWVVVGIMWNRLSIITTNLVITIVSLIGFHLYKLVVSTYFRQIEASLNMFDVFTFLKADSGVTFL